MIKIKSVQFRDPALVGRITINHIPHPSMRDEVELLVWDHEIGAVVAVAGGVASFIPMSNIVSMGAPDDFVTRVVPQLIADLDKPPIPPIPTVDPSAGLVDLPTRGKPGPKPRA